MPPSDLRAQAEDAVGAGAGEHHRDRPGPMILGERAQEDVDRPPLAARRARPRGLEDAVLDRQRLIGSDDVNVIGRDRGRPAHLDHRQPGAAAEQLGQVALVGGIQMGGDDEGDAGTRRHGAEHLLERLEAARRGPYTDDGKLGHASSRVIVGAEHPIGTSPGPAEAVGHEPLGDNQGTARMAAFQPRVGQIGNTVRPGRFEDGPAVRAIDPAPARLSGRALFLVKRTDTR